MPELLTDWLTIGTSGPTADGRIIKPETLEEMAESYDPENYTAVVNVNHWYGNLGTVRKLRTIIDKAGRTALQAIIRPNKYYLRNISEDIGKFFSMEIIHKFAGTGKAYLSGLASTDTPASLGTTEARFSRDDNTQIERGEPVEFSREAFAFDNPGDEKGFVAAIVAGLKDVFSNNNNNNQKEDFSMTEEQTKTLLTGQQTLTDSVNNLITLLTPKKEGDAPTVVVPETPAVTTPETPKNNDFATLTENKRNDFISKWYRS